jgi:hypothetical protein
MNLDPLRLLPPLLVALLPAAVHAQPAPAPAASPARASAPSPAPPPIRALEQAIETHSGALLLPGTAAGTLTVTPCAGCRPLTLLDGASTTWMLGDRAVGFADLRRMLQANPRLPVLVFYRSRDLALTRLVARAGAAEMPR